MTDIRPNIYSGAGLDRAALHRKDEAWLAEARRASGTVIAPVWRTLSFITGPADMPRAGLLPGGGDWGPELLFLGLSPDGAPVFAADLSVLEQPETLPVLAGLDGRFENLRASGPLLPRWEANALAYARAIVWWNARNRFCGVCGAPALSELAGHARMCTDPACATRHFPRTDPAVIMLVHDGADRVLLGRQAAWPQGQHSVLAGFVEPGESLEDAVAREVFEETGVRVTDVRYQHSQPWPFPASVMLGFTARAVTTEVVVDTEELESARWVTRAEIVNRDNETLRLPHISSIAHRLITEWLEGR